MIKDVKIENLAFQFNSVFRTTPEVSIKFYFVDISLRAVMAC